MFEHYQFFRQQLLEANNLLNSTEIFLPIFQLLPFELVFHHFHADGQQRNDQGIV